MKSTEWLNDARFTSWRLDISDLGWPDPTLAEKWRRRAETFQKEGANAVVLCGFQFRWDYLVILDRVLGILHEITEICHEHQLKVVEYHSPTLLHTIRSEEDRRTIHNGRQEQVPFYPDDWRKLSFQEKRLANWRQVSARNGKPVFYEPFTCECFCPNHPEFQKAYRAFIRHHLAEIPVDAILSADLHFLPDIYSCACTYCQKRFLSEYGFELPPTEDPEFWENRENPAFLAWIAARYRWNAEHYQRLRKWLPPEVLLWGRASCCLSAELPQTGFSPQLCAEHFDAIFYEIDPRHHPTNHSEEIASEITAFSSIARHFRKPLIALCHVHSSEDLPGWLDFLKPYDARPWISRQTLHEDAVPEESLLETGFDYPETPPGKPTFEPVQAIFFSETFRDSLEIEQGKDYVAQCRELCADLVARGIRPFLLFDTMWDSAAPALWECLWMLDPRALDKEKERKIAEWQQQGLAIGLS
ncbi:MAG TPA: hypothetical protein VK041_05260 [Opitutales bacterium]|nr:hypothetical protein [Opitutales bacterium]